jgi:hypothetical protein
LFALQIGDDLRMPIPSRLANDGWWLCDLRQQRWFAFFLSRQAAQMTEFSAPASNAGSIQENSFSAKLPIALTLALLADWLFYDQRIGISAVVFAVALSCGALLANFARLNRAQVLLAGLLVLAGLIPAVEEFNAASFLFIVLALGVGLSLTTNRKLTGVGEQAAALCDLYLTGPFRLLGDAVRMFSLPALTAGFTVWFIPVLLGSIFVFLLASANPLLEKWISLLNPGNTTFYVSLSRVLFWVAALSLVWPFVDVRWRRKVEMAADPAAAETTEQEKPDDAVDFFGMPTILRSLILFNLLFAVQTVLDVFFLWGNATLPADISYAAYAHRGAYPLILTALLAAGFVLIAMNPGRPAERSRVIRPLVYLWVAQNVLLVASSILRLDLYVQIYLLTWWRVAAFIWMLLVAVGLLLIIARIRLNRSNDWLIRANLITLTATLYVCSLVNFAAIIANYNVDHSRETSGKGVAIDIDYLFHLGPQALPAIDRAIALRGSDPNLVSRRYCLVEQHRNDLVSWRAWGFRSWRLQRTLDAQKSSTVG